MSNEPKTPEPAPPARGEANIAQQSDAASTSGTAIVSAHQVLATQDPNLAQSTVETRFNFAVQHLYSAGRLSRQVAAIEQNPHNQPTSVPPELFTFATAAIYLSVAAMEAYANELYMDSRDVPSHPLSDLVKLDWATYRWKEVIYKFKTVLEWQNKPQLKGEASLQNLQKLIRLRNALVHFIPEWWNARQEHEEVSKQLANAFETSRFYPGEPIFPRAWASHSCTTWAVRTCINFATEFEKLADLSPKFPPLDQINP